MRALRVAALMALATLVALAAFKGRDARLSEVAAQDAAGANEKPASGDTFVHASIGDITGLIPNITSDGVSHTVGNLIYDGLVQLDKDLNWAPSMAESWQFSKDCLTLTFKLRKNVKWHDGRPFTADDVIFTYKTMINPKTPTAYRDDFEPVKEAQALDPYTVRTCSRRPSRRASSARRPRT
jgi:peptide/nickel transport system substrate-binding protein